MATKTTKMITNTQDRINSEDVIERIAELEDIEERSEDENEELESLSKLNQEGEDYLPDWKHGCVFMVHESIAADEFIEKLEEWGSLDSSRPSYIAIDAEQTLQNASMSGAVEEIDFDGQTYYVL